METCIIQYIIQAAFIMKYLQQSVLQDIKQILCSRKRKNKGKTILIF